MPQKGGARKSRRAPKKAIRSRASGQAGGINLYRHGRNALNAINSVARKVRPAHHLLREPFKGVIQRTPYIAPVYSDPRTQHVLGWLDKQGYGKAGGCQACLKK